MSDTYYISDLTKYAESIRKNAALSLNEQSQESLNDYITLSQVEQIIESNSIGKDDDGNLIIDEDSFNDTFEEVRIWIYNAALSKLASENKLECAWDSKINEMIFWLPSSELTLKDEDEYGSKSS